MGDAYYQALAEASVPAASEILENENEQIEHSVAGGTFREQIVRARRGQGVFRSNVRQKETECRVTHVGDEKHLKASHIKPWRDSTDQERLDGSNGLLLAPHVDHLFDGGYISFSSSRGLLVVPEVRSEILDAWGIDAGATIGEFSREQNAYLEYHRSNIFKTI
jgi:predicted restriction endonuclease